MAAKTRLLCALMVAALAAAAGVEADAKVADDAAVGGRDGGSTWNTLPTLKKSDSVEVGSGDDEDYDDTDEDDDDDDDDDVEGSGDEDDDSEYKWYDDVEDEEANSDSSTTTAPTLASSNDDDIHFDEANNHHDDELYEYYNEEYYEDDYDDDGSDDIITDDDDDHNVIDIDDGGDNGVAGSPVSGDWDHRNHDDEGRFAPPPPAEPSPPYFKISYIYIMLASAVVSFSLVLMVFIVCRRSSLERQEKLRQTNSPFLVSDPRTGYRPASSSAPRPTPIVKNYQRVPTSTREFLQQQQQPHTAVDVDVKKGAEKPLLT